MSTPSNLFCLRHWLYTMHDLSYYCAQLLMKSWLSPPDDHGDLFGIWICLPLCCRSTHQWKRAVVSSLETTQATSLQSRSIILGSGWWSSALYIINHNCIWIITHDLCMIRKKRRALSSLLITILLAIMPLMWPWKPPAIYLHCHCF
jgi:hypothetical protein